MAEYWCKVCGLTRLEDVQLCHELEVEFTGFIFAPKSPRRVLPEFVRDLPVGFSRKVGVFAGMDVEDILEISRVANLDYIQLHGGEGPEVCKALGPERVFKVLWPEGMEQGQLQQELDRFAPVVKCFLLDAGTTGGGSGKNFDYSLLHNMVFPRPWLMAGGMGPATIASALSVCTPRGIDMNSALETAPGIKDPTLVREAVQMIRTL